MTTTILDPATNTLTDIDGPALIADNVISFVVHGVAKPAGSKRAFPIHRTDGSVGVAVSDMSVGAKSWKQEIAYAARQVYRGPLLTCPLEVSFTFYVVRPKGHFSKRGGIKASAPTYPITRPDVLKLARCAEDALTGILWRDDAQIFDERIKKIYGDTAKVEIEIVLREHDRP